jgi:hypothetical protein
MKSPFAVADKYLAKPRDTLRLAVAQDLPPRACVHKEVRSEDGTLQAVMVYSEPLNDLLWLILDRSYEPKDSLAIYYPEELPELKTKTLEQLREIHKVKLAFPGSRVIQEGPEAKR